MNIDEKPPACEWSIAIFAARESPETLASSLAAVLNACKNTPVIIDVVVNGNSDLAHKFARKIDLLAISVKKPLTIRIWDISVADKAYAWNKYIHNIWPDSKIAYFIDGYVQVVSNSLSLISAGLDSNSNALAATGVTTTGRSARLLRKELLTHGGLHGNLYALKGDVMRKLKDINFLLPIGIYRTDPTVGAALAYALDPSRNSWNLKQRILVHPKATWIAPELSPWRIKDLLTQWKRILRQAQGVLETQAVREHFAVQKRSPESLPGTASELVKSWIDSHPNDARKIFFRNPLCLLAAVKLSRQQITADENELPKNIYKTSVLRDS